jgi:hypothetical protein
VLEQNAFYTVWQPKITHIMKRQSSKPGMALFEIYGQYFQTGCLVYFRDVQVRPEQVEYVDPTHLNITVSDDPRQIGSAIVRVVNAGGKEAAATVIAKAPPETKARTKEPPSASPPIEPPSASPPIVPFEKREPLAVVAVCAFPKLLQDQLKYIQPGHVELENGAVVAKVIHVIGRKTPMAAVAVPGHGGLGAQWTSNRTMVITHLLLKAEIDQESDGITYYSHRGKLLLVGTVLDLRIDGTAAIAVVLSPPMQVNRSMLDR